MDLRIGFNDRSLINIFSACAPHPAPADGSVTCDGNPVPQGGECRFECDTGYDLLGLSLNICYNGQWIRNAPTCERE